ncbi:MAG TPA: hypothetical protein EYP36_07725 [Calditrichaeota bacterium]|nr:hypothetical protein [Calditrichota bacterium]
MRGYIFTLLISLAILSCTGERIVTKFYVIDDMPLLPVDSSVAFQSPLPYVVMVDNFSISRIYDSNRIALRTKSNEISYYFYHKWAENPSAAFQTLLWRQLRSLNLFKTCNLRRIDPEPQFKITGYIDRIERVEQDNYDAAHLIVTLEFKEYKSGRTLVQHGYNRLLPLNKKDMNNFASALNQIITQQNSIFFEKIQSYLLQHKK